MVELYGSPRTSAGRCYLVLEEIGLPYRPMPIDMMEKREHKAPAYLAMNPNGKVPCLVDGELTLWESVAINHYLAERYKPAVLGSDVAMRARVAQWSMWSQVELQPPMIDIVIQKVFTPEDKRDLGVIERAEQAIPPKLEILDAHLAGREFLVGESLTLADLNVASVVNIMTALRMSRAPYTNLEAWFGRVQERPSYRKWMELRKS